MDMLEALIAEETDDETEDETEDETGESLRLIDGKGGILMPGDVYKRQSKSLGYS